MPATYRDGKRVEDDLMSSPPPARPAGLGEPQAREASGGGGKGGVAESQEQITNSMEDKKWGYFDPYTGKKVPWFIDMINGGGKNSAGEKFEGGFGSVGLAGGLMNMLGIDPYGQSRERTYGGGDFYRGGKLDPSLLYQFGRTAPAPAGGGVQPTLTPRMRPSEEERLMNIPVQAMSAEDRLMGMPVQAMSAEDRLMGMPVQANPFYAKAASEAGMGLSPFGGSSGLGVRQAEPSYSQAATGDVGSIFQTPDYQQYVNAVREMEKGMGLLPFTEDQMRMAYAKKGRY